MEFKVAEKRTDPNAYVFVQATDIRIGRPRSVQNGTKLVPMQASLQGERATEILEKRLKLSAILD